MNRLYFVIGILCFLIPLSLKIIDGKEQEGIIATHDKVLEEYGEEEKEICIQNAISYNEALFELQKTTFGSQEQEHVSELEYEKQLDLANTGMMGNLEIPKIDLRLPVYHGTSDDVLANGVGHLQGTSLPVGGVNSHTVLTGHCGLPDAELFTKLDELGKGDQFFLRVCGKLLAYEVERILVVDPEDAGAIEIEEGKDLVSLVTCTPYGINTHRLIVTGSRIEKEGETWNLMDAERGVDEKIYYLAAISTILLIYLVCTSVRRKPRNYSE